MTFVVRFVQEYVVAERDAFMELEGRFAEMERRRPDWPQGRRLQPYAGADVTNALVWETTVGSLGEAEAALAQIIEGDEEHAALFARQAPFITRTRTEILEVLDL